VRRRGAPPGASALVFATGFLAFRVLNQALRPDAPGASLPHELPLAGYAAAAVGAGALLALTLARRTSPGGRRPVAAPAS